MPAWMIHYKLMEAMRRRAMPWRYSALSRCVPILSLAITLAQVLSACAAGDNRLVDDVASA
eukprot:971164-Pleurochrysis_carterae.AAC.1